MNPENRGAFLNADVCRSEFSGKMLIRGFWLYVCDVTTPVGKHLYYVGRTGDSSSTNAQSPFNRMGQHLGQLKNSNMLKKHLQAKGIEPINCSFNMAAIGPLWGEALDSIEHSRIRDKVAGLESGLEKSMTESGYEVMNKVKSRKPVDESLLQEIIGKLSHEFPLLKMRRAQGTEDGCE